MHSDLSFLLFHFAVYFPYMDNKAYLGLYLIFFSQNEVQKSCMTKRFERLRRAWNITVILPCKNLTDYCRDLCEICNVSEISPVTRAVIGVDVYEFQKITPLWMSRWTPFCWKERQFSFESLHAPFKGQIFVLFVFFLAHERLMQKKRFSDPKIIQQSSKNER